MTPGSPSSAADPGADRTSVVLYPGQRSLRAGFGSGGWGRGRQDVSESSTNTGDQSSRGDEQPCERPIKHVHGSPCLVCRFHLFATISGYSFGGRPLGDVRHRNPIFKGNFASRLSTDLEANTDQPPATGQVPNHILRAYPASVTPTTAELIGKK